MFRKLFSSKKNRRIDAADKDLLKRLKEDFDLKPRNLELYKIALIHKSASTIVSKGKRVNNERLEYLGDSVLDAIVSNYLFANFPNQNEGFLTKMRSRIVSRFNLNNLALTIGLDKLVVMQTTNPSAQKHIFGDALEAFIGAIYLDKGFSKTSKWVVKNFFKTHINLKELQTTETDYKSRIIEFAQKHKYEILFESSETESSQNHNPQFECKLYLNKRVLGSGFGASKKEAEQNAAMVALERIDIISLHKRHVVPKAISWEN